MHRRRGVSRRRKVGQSTGRYGNVRVSIESSPWQGEVDGVGQVVFIEVRKSINKQSFVVLV